jgi:hypothetical protein
MRYVSPIVALLLGASACTDHSPARIQFTEDTTTVNTRLASDVGVRVLDKHGHVVDRARVGYEVAPDSILWVMANGKFGCLRNGVGVVSVSSGRLGATTHVRCDLIATLGPASWGAGIQLVLGGPPVPVPVDPRDARGERMDRVRFPITVHDSTIVQLKDGMLVGLRMGSTSVDATAGGKANIFLDARVYESVLSATPVSLAPGESVTEPLVAGEYQFDTRFDGGGTAAWWSGTSCPPAAPALEIHASCTTIGGGALVIRNTSALPVRGYINLMRTAPRRRNVRERRVAL